MATGSLWDFSLARLVFINCIINYLQALIAAICAVGMVLATPSAFYAGVAVESEGEQVLR